MDTWVKPVLSRAVAADPAPANEEPRLCTLEKIVFAMEEVGGGPSGDLVAILDNNCSEKRHTIK